MALMFLISTIILLVSACGVVICRDAIFSALWLIVNLITVAVFFAMMQAHFLAAAQVIVYAGAIMVLVIFVIMLLKSKNEGFSFYDGLLTVIATFIAFIFGKLLVKGAVIFSSDRLDYIFVDGSAKSLGKVLFADYYFPFEAASLLIIAAIVGAVMIAVRKKHIKVKGDM